MCSSCMHCSSDLGHLPPHLPTSTIHYPLKRGRDQGGREEGRESAVTAVCDGTGQQQISTHTNPPLVIGVCTLTSQYITSSTVTLIVVLVITYPLQDRHTFLPLLQTSPNLTSQYSVMEDELFELRERERAGW